MLSRWFRKHSSQQDRLTAPISPGVTIYAVGDIHGRADLLLRLMTLIHEDIVKKKISDAKIVFLGDYIDRGEESARVLNILHDLWKLQSSNFLFLRGNHEAAMMAFIDEPETHGEWLRFGGLQTIHSFGIGGINETADAAARIEIASKLRRAIEPVEDFLRNGLVNSAHYGNIFLCHAAYDSSFAADQQPEETLLWGNPDFLKTGGPDAMWVVHGHTASDYPIIAHNRICVDTGAYYSGRLTSAVITENHISFMNT